MLRPHSIATCLLSFLIAVPSLAADATAPDQPQFGRHVTPLLSKLGCNGGTCHGAVQGKNGFRLSLFGAKPDFDHLQLTRDQNSRRLDLMSPEQSLILQKASGRVPHGGGKLIERDSFEYHLLRNWIANGAPLHAGDSQRVVELQVTPREQTLKPDEKYQLVAVAKFADGTTEDVTRLCSFQSLDENIATVSRRGEVTAENIGDASLVVRYRDEPTAVAVLVTRGPVESFPDVKPHNFVDERVLDKLRRLGLPPAELCDDATFLRRVRLDVTGQLPTAEEVREFLADTSADKRTKKIEQLLSEPGYAALWTLKFCDLLGASDFGIYADGLAEHFEAPRFQAWVRARMEENIPYDEFAARILLATSREGRSLEEWSQEVLALQQGYATPRKDLDLYAQRKTLDVYWQRRDANGVPGAMQVAHAFLGLRLQCAQCHRHPHDVWQQDDVLSFANFFVRVRTVGFQGDNEKKLPEQAKLFKQMNEEGKKLAEEAKKLKEGKVKELAEKAKKAESDRTKLKSEIAKLEQANSTEGLEEKKKELADAEQLIADHKAAQQEASEMEKKGKLLSDDVSKRVLHAEIFHRAEGDNKGKWASVDSPLGSQSSKEFRLLGDREPLTIATDEDPREKFVAWLRKPDNPFFAKAIVNRVWAHYFDRGLIDPPDDLSPFNPSTHPALLDDLTKGFVAAKFDLKWLHRTILASRTYQQSSAATEANAADRSNYSHFARRRLPAEVLLDALNQATGTRDDLDMKYFHWPENLKTVEVPYMPKNGFVVFVLEQFGRSERNSSVQCDCQRQSEASLLQVLSLANHPQIWKKISDPNGRVAKLMKEVSEPQQRIETLYLSTLNREPTKEEIDVCLGHLQQAESPEKGLQTVLWCLVNTKEFLLQH
jgi:hypothetical protein